MSEARSVLVTGGASGIGAAVVRAFAAEGARVVSLDRVDSPDAAVSVVGDVREPADHVAAVAAAGDRLDVLVVNAGVHDGGLSLDAAPDALVAGMERVLAVDVLGYVLALHAGAAALRASGGTVVMTLSDASFLAGQTGAGVAYTAAKHAQAGVLAWAARWFAPEVRVNAVAPGGVLTDLREAVGGAPLFTDPEAKRASIASRNPLGTVLTADEVAAYYTWLAGPHALGLTGQVVRPDGGLSVR